MGQVVRGLVCLMAFGFLLLEAMSVLFAWAMVKPATLWGLAILAGLIGFALLDLKDLSRTGK